MPSTIQSWMCTCPPFKGVQDPREAEGCPNGGRLIMSFYGTTEKGKQLNCKLDEHSADFKYLELRKKKWERESALQSARAMYDAYLRVVEHLQKKGIPVVPLSFERFMLTNGYALTRAVAASLMKLYKKDPERCAPLDRILLASQYLIMHLHPSQEKTPEFINLTEEVLGEVPPNRIAIAGGSRRVVGGGTTAHSKERVW